MEEILVCKRLVVLILSVFVVGEFASVCCQGMNMSNSSSSSNGTSVVMRKKRHPWIGPIGTRHITVDQNGQGNFLTVQDAVNSIPDGNRMRVIINIHAGLYEEKVIVPEGKPYITFKGAGKDVTMIQWHNRACDLDPTGQQLHTYHSASVSVLANYFTAKNISFRNTAPAPLPGVEGWQAVAFRISGDKALFLGCGFYGAQDTLCDDSGRHYFKECFIQGSIDFIFGNGRSMYKHCELHSMAREFGSIAAQNRAGEDEKTGFAFVHCRVTGSGPLYIGRAMGQHSRIVYAYTYFEDIVASVAWDDWDHNSTKHKTAFFGVYKCYGPGAGNAAAVSWAPELSFQQARPFLVKSFVNGRHWINPADA